MKTPRFWNRPTPGLAARLLQPIGSLYGFITARRMRRPSMRLALPVVCIGNLTAGGTGKTPTALALAAWLQKNGETPAFLTRGYGGGLAGPVVVDAASHSARDVGDESLLLARQAPTIVARDRRAGAQLAINSGCSVLIMDDGLQNPSLEKTFAIAVVDAGAGFGNGLCVPAGPLRAPLEAQAPFVHALLAIGTDIGAKVRTDAVSRFAARHQLALHNAAFTVSEPATAKLSGMRVLAFAGIGRPEKFFDTLRDCGATVVAHRTFADHHSFTDADATDLLNAAQEQALTLVTTEKDHIRLAGSAALAALAQASFAVPVTLTLPAALTTGIAEAISAFRASA